MLLIQSLDQISTFPRVRVASLEPKLVVQLHDGNFNLRHRYLTLRSGRPRQHLGQLVTTALAMPANNRERRSVPPQTKIQTDRETLRMYLSQAASAVPAVVQRLQQADLEPIEVTLAQPTLDDVFLQVTGQRLQD